MDCSNAYPRKYHLLVAFVVLAALVLLCIGRDAILPEGHSDITRLGQRILHFPLDRSLGMIQLRDAGQEEASWEPLARARGDVSIPEGKDVLLTIRENTCDSLPLLKTLGPSDLFQLVVCIPTLDDESLKYLKHLTGLKRLSIGSGDAGSQCSLVGEGLRYLKNMKELRMLSISAAQVTDENLAHLRSLVSLEEVRLSAISSLKGPGLEYVGNCPKLRSLFLYQVPITNDGLMYLRKMDRLEKLHLQYTHITGEGLLHLTALKKLKELTLPEGITDADLLHVARLTGLEKLCVDCRSIGNESMGYLQDLHKLRDLTITFGRLSEKGMTCIRALPSLRRLTIHLDGLEDKDIKLIQGLTCLVGLYPRSQWVTDDGLARLQGMKALENLSLNGMPITDGGLSYLSGLTALRYLDLTSTKVTDAGLSHLSGLSALENIHLSDTGVTGVGLTYFKSLLNLRILSLHDCPIDNSIIPSFKSLQSLQGLDVRRTYVDERGLEELKQALPNCQIGWQAPQLRIGDSAPPITIDGFVRAPSDAVATWDALKAKVVVLEFWATWCDPCIDAMPHINALVDRFKDEPVRFISITEEAEGLVKEFLREHTVKSWVALDADGSMRKACMAIGIPYCVVVDKQGIVRARFHPNRLTEGIIQDLLRQ